MQTFHIQGKGLYSIVYPKIIYLSIIFGTLLSLFFGGKFGLYAPFKYVTKPEDIHLTKTSKIYRVTYVKLVSVQSLADAGPRHLKARWSKVWQMRISTAAESRSVVKRSPRLLPLKCRGAPLCSSPAWEFFIVCHLNTNVPVVLCSVCLRCAALLPLT